MKFAPFDYVRAATVADVIAVLAADDDAKVLAGGQSLLPLMALRLARPSVLVDLADLPLSGVERTDESPYLDGPTLRVGALTRQYDLETATAVREHAPLLAAAVRHVGHPATRNRGTLGGSLAHADPAAELAAAAVALGAVVVAVGPDGTRALPCSTLAAGTFTTTLDRAEVLTEVHVPISRNRTGSAFCEWAPRAGDFAEVGIGITLDLAPEGTCTAIRGAACGIGPIPLDLGPALEAAGTVGAAGAGPDLLRAVAARVESASGPGGEDKAALAGLLAARATAEAFADAARRSPVDR